MRGHLTEQPLVALIHEIHLRRRAGALRLEHDAVKVVIYFEGGEVIYAASNVRDLRLAEYLRKQQLVSAEELETLDGNKSDLVFAAALANRKLLPEQEILALLTRQASDVLRVALLWTQGSWEFDPHIHLDDPTRVQIELPSLLVQASRKVSAAFIAAQLANTSEIFSPAAGTPDFTSLLPTEGFVLSRVDAPMDLTQLVLLSGLREADALRTVYALAVGGFIARKHWPSALNKEKVRVKAKAGTGAMAPEVSVHTLATELEELLQRLDEASSYYEILNVGLEAADSEIKSSYYALARRYHPDRFHMQAGTPLHATIESAFARIAQAYVTLIDPSQRGTYDAKLAARQNRRTPTVVPPPPAKKIDRKVSEQNSDKSALEDEAARAEDSFQEGYIALQTGHTQAALISLASAARLVPGDARYRAYYGRALAAQEDTRRLAEAELQTALKLEPANAGYRLMLAELYYDLGFLRRSENELKRVLAAEPNNAGGRKLWRRLEAARTTT